MYTINKLSSAPMIEPVKRLRCVVKITSNSYFDSSGSFISKRSMRVLKRKSDLNFDDIGFDMNFDSPINFNEVNDGIYEIITINEVHDRETGYIDDWELELIPYKE